MSLRMTRLSAGEWLLGVSSVFLLVDLFGVSWFAYGSRFHAVAAMLGQSSSANGWNTFNVLGPLTLVVCMAGIATVLLAVARSSPALPVVINTLLLPVSFVLAVLVAVRVLIDAPSVRLIQAGGANVISAQPGAYVGLALTLALFAGAYLSMRRDAVAAEDSPIDIEHVSVVESRRESRA